MATLKTFNNPTHSRQTQRRHWGTGGDDETITSEMRDTLGHKTENGKLIKVKQETMPSIMTSV